MKKQNNSVEIVLESLKERAKELNCLYRIEEILNEPDSSIENKLTAIARAIPPGYQYPDICEAVINYDENRYESAAFQQTDWVQRAQIMVQETAVGFLEVCYLEERPQADEGPFLREERKLINTIAERLGHFLLHNRLRQIYQEWQEARENLSDKKKEEWRIILDLLYRTDQNLFIRVARKMLNSLSWSGVQEAQNLLHDFVVGQRGEENDYLAEINRPHKKFAGTDISKLSEQIFEIAAKNRSSMEILKSIQKWIQEDKSSFLIRTLENQHSSLSDIIDSLTRFFHLAPEGMELSESARKALNVSLIRRFFTDQLEFINVAKFYTSVTDFYELLQRMVYPSFSHGKLGGKSAGLFLAHRIISRGAEENPLLANIKIPKTWYITSDALLHFLHYNNLEEVIEQKYKEIDQVRQEYPHIVQVFKHSHFPPEIVKGLSMVLDDMGNNPLIVRSSSLLEDRLGSAFSGKYKSLFLANQGSKEERMESLLDAIAEVYASTFSPDPIEYRAERGLIDFHEEMGIMIQQVVGQKVGKYFLPAFAGVAFSNNEFRWSPRIKREDGLIRLVPGLGTRAVDRLSDDYPVLVAPGQPGLRVNVSPEEVMYYTTKKVDVINLESNSFETVDMQQLLNEYGMEYPQIQRIVSVVEDHHIRKLSGIEMDMEKKDLVVTFDGIISDTGFVKEVKAILQLLAEKLKTPVDIEFGHDGKNFYLLQCRPQSHSKDVASAPIPKDIPEEQVIFSANRYVSNGRCPDITHIVYVVPEKYAGLEKMSDLKAVAQAVSKLNKLLPKRRFILMGPGRWGSRGDIKLGVPVTYSGINNSAVLIEIARKKGNYVPDLSFGTHFFQDLVEASIRYLPLYPDDRGTMFNEHFLETAPNILEEILPEFRHLAEVIRVIDVPEITDGKVLRVLMNADLDDALGYLTQPVSAIEGNPEDAEIVPEAISGEHWRWRMRMAHRIAAKLDPVRFGVKAFYVFGSTKNANAGPGSDIDLLIHFDGTEAQKKELLLWLEGWSMSLGEINYLRTGYTSDGLLDVHIVTDEDIRKRTSYALKINAVTDPARHIPLKTEQKNRSDGAQV